jgi:hypothetical protein
VTPLACAPRFDDCMTLWAAGDTDRYTCSNEIPNALIPCPGGVSEAVFCDPGEVCAYGPETFENVGDSAANAASAMCVCENPTTITVETSVMGSTDPFCVNNGYWQVDDSSDWTFDADSGSPCVLSEAWDASNKNYAWLDADACCSTEDGWSSMRVVVTVTATDMPRSGKGQVLILLRDAAGNPSDDGVCTNPGPLEGYEFELDYGNQEVDILSRTGCNKKTSLASTPLTLAVGTAYTLTAVADGTALSLYVDGVLQLTASDSTWTEGSMGLFVEDLDADFESLTVEDISTVDTCG